jgi:hypothetical protein
MGKAGILRLDTRLCSVRKQKSDGRPQEASRRVFHISSLVCSPTSGVQVLFNRLRNVHFRPQSVV